MSEHRRANLLILFQEFVAQAQQEDPGVKIAGLDRAFALKLQVQNTALSSMKSGARTIGPKLARQFEAAFGRPPGWMDEPHAPAVVAIDDKEVERFAKLATRVFRRSDAKRRAQLTDFIKWFASENAGPEGAEAEAARKTA